jgi:hypothetical protein
MKKITSLEKSYWHCGIFMLSFRASLGRFRLRAIRDLSKAARLPLPVEGPKLAAGCIIPESLGIGRTSDEFDAHIAHRGACGGGEIGLR